RLGSLLEHDNPKWPKSVNLKKLCGSMPGFQISSNALYQLSKIVNVSETCAFSNFPDFIIQNFKNGNFSLDAIKSKLEYGTKKIITRQTVGEDGKITSNILLKKEN